MEKRRGALMQLAHDVRVGDVVEFEAGVPVTVTDIEENYAPEDDPSPHGLRAAGRSLVFGAVFGDRDDPLRASFTTKVKVEARK